MSGTKIIFNILHRIGQIKEFVVFQTLNTKNDTSLAFENKL